MRAGWQNEAKTLYANGKGMSMLAIAVQLQIEVEYVCALLKPSLGKDKRAGYRAANTQRYRRKK